MKVLPISGDTLENMYSRWKKVVDLGEFGVILWLPKTDQFRRILQFIPWIQKKNPKLHIVHIDVISDRIEDISQLEKYLSQASPIIISSAQRLFDPDLHHILQYLIRYNVDRSIPILLHCEHSPGLIINNPIFQSQITLHQHIVYQALYDHSDVDQFLTYLEDKWQINLTSEQKETIWTFCGGYLWLVKEVVRQLATDHTKTLSNIFSSEAFQWKVQAIWDAFHEDTKKYLITFTQSKEDFNNHELCVYGLIQKNKLPQFLMNHIKTLHNTLVFQDNRYVLNGVDVSREFSKKELKLLHTFLHHKDVILSREEVAQRYWENYMDEKYSDWALDQCISRTRKKLTKLGCFSPTIRAVRGKGYLYA